MKCFVLPFRISRNVNFRVLKTECILNEQTKNMKETERNAVIIVNQNMHNKTTPNKTEIQQLEQSLKWCNTFKMASFSLPCTENCIWTLPLKQTLWSKTQTEVQFTFENKTLKMLFIRSPPHVRHPLEKSYQNNILRHYIPSTVPKKFLDFNEQKPFSEVVRNRCFAWLGSIRLGNVY